MVPEGAVERSFAAPERRLNRLPSHNGYYTLSELNYDVYTGGITLFANVAAVVPGHSVKENVDSFGKPDDRIKADVVNVLGLHEEVKWMAVNPDSFYPTIDAAGNRHIRAALVSDAVYGLENSDPKQYALKYLKQPEVEKLIAELSPADQLLILDALFYRDPPSSSVWELKAGLYLDYTAKGSAKYILAFAGTENSSILDWLTNLHQAAEPGEPQYVAAIIAARRLSMVNELQGSWTVTGHSLGGGLAAAAALAANVHADTFNAAGLQRHTLCKPSTYDEEAGVCDALDDNPGLLTRFDTMSATLVDNYRIWWTGARPDGTIDSPDILSLVQSASPLLPVALGTTHDIEGLYNLTSFEHTVVSTLVTSLSKISSLADWPNVIAAILPAILAASSGKKLVDSHLMDSVIYGLLHCDACRWNVYGYAEDWLIEVVMA